MKEKRGAAKKKPKKEKKEKKAPEPEKVAVEPTEIKLQSPLGGSDIKYRPSFVERSHSKI